MVQNTQRRAAIAGEIRAELGRQNLTYKALSEGTGIPAATMSRRLKGIKPFNVEELQSIAQFLGLTLSELTERSEVAA